MTDKQLAQLCADLYANPSPLMSGGIAYSITETETEFILCPRGTKSPEELLEDLAVLPIWTALGFVHSGMWLGVSTLYALIKPLALAAIAEGKKVRVIGHSLGGGHGHQIVGLFCLDNIPCELITFASPRCAWANLRRIFEKSGIEHRNYRFKNDPITQVPWEPYEPTEDYIALTGETDPSDKTPLRDHHIVNYVNAL